MSIKNALPVFVLGVLASGLTPRPAVAATASASFSVSAVVEATCRATANTMALRTLAAAVLNPTSPVSVDCSNPVPYRVNITAGFGLGDTMAMREISLNSPRRGIVIRGQSMGGVTMIGVGSRFARSLADQGRVLAKQYFAANAQFDTLIVTVTY